MNKSRMIPPNMNKEHGYREGGLSSIGKSRFYYTCKCGRVFTGNSYAESKMKYLHHIYWARELSNG